MGQKVNPVGLRLGINRTWDSRWYSSDKEYAGLLHEDLKIRKYLEQRLAQAGVARIVIERPAKKARITIHSARPPSTTAWQACAPPKAWPRSAQSEEHTSELQPLKH